MTDFRVFCIFAIPTIGLAIYTILHEYIVELKIEKKKTGKIRIF